MPRGTKASATQFAGLRTTTIRRVYRFEAAHFLPMVPDGHKCKNMHGHNYKVDVELIGEVDHHGWLIDFFDLDKLWSSIHDLVDHSLLNDHVENPTSEVLCHWFRDMLQEQLDAIEVDVNVAIKSITVYENDDSSAKWDLFEDYLWDIMQGEES